ncbi:hypothetical protein CHS0354_006839 [Potamilus streckersoni]|uniref:Transketolase-like C-terminal domain-containing protein n=1 Tax=Potamilus streckersoni TaxID=2493646 RepID=A0AAE0TFK7_9BIVA|nr:hypothetical protein CHS0354_006839 [Potamilus streckersoni]
MSHFSKGGYVLSDRRNPSVLIIATGSEVSVALKAQSLLDEKNIAYAEPRTVLNLSRRLTVTVLYCLALANVQSLKRRYGRMGGLCQRPQSFYRNEQFGASAPDKDLFNQFGITAEAVAAKLSA